MRTSRRQFVATSLAASAAAASGTALHAQKTAAREYYELRAYRLTPGAATTALDTYFEKAFLPALEKRGITTAGVFTELEVNKQAQTSAAKPDTPTWVLIPHASLDSFVRVGAELNADPAVQKAGAGYLQVAKATPAFDRIDTWLYLAFKGHPTMTVPDFAKKRLPTRVFEMRDYESHSEMKALAKIAMFDEGESEIMRTLGMSPLFFGQGLAGPNLPHLRYITSGPDLATHLDAWKKFGPDPRWMKMKDLPQYADSTSKNTARFLARSPTRRFEGPETAWRLSASGGGRHAPRRQSEQRERGRRGYLLQPERNGLGGHHALEFTGVGVVDQIVGRQCEGAAEDVRRHPQGGGQRGVQRAAGDRPGDRAGADARIEARLDGGHGEGHGPGREGAREEHARCHRDGALEGGAVNRQARSSCVMQQGRGGIAFVHALEGAAAPRQPGRVLIQQPELQRQRPDAVVGGQVCEVAEARRRRTRMSRGPHHLDLVGAGRAIGAAEHDQGALRRGWCEQEHEQHGKRTDGRKCGHLASLDTA